MYSDTLPLDYSFLKTNDSWWFYWLLKADERILVTILPDIFDNTDASTIDLDDLVAEIMWLIKRDDSTDRADQGATMITLGDMSMQFDSSKTGVMIAPEIITRYDLSASGQRRRVGRYELPIEDTARTGFYLGDKERFRYDK